MNFILRFFPFVRVGKRVFLPEVSGEKVVSDWKRAAWASAQADAAARLKARMEKRQAD